MAEPLKVLILGATSGIAEATARIYAAEKAKIVLAGRNEGRLQAIQTDLRVRGATQVEVRELDFVGADVPATFEECVSVFEGLDHIIVAYGVMIEQSDAERDLHKADAMIATNFASQARWILEAANYLERRGKGSLVVLGSPAGDRGRRKNYVYGATKAGIAVLTQGIAHRFANKGPRAVVVKPGPTATAMTANLPGDFSKMERPEQVAAIVRRAADKGGPIQYAPAKWRLIMRIVREIPAPIFNRLNF